MILLKGLEGPVTVKGQQYGSAVMQPWEKTLTDAKIADVLTYIRQEWGNTAPPVAPEGIAALRKEVASHTGSFHANDLLAIPEDAMLPGGEAARRPREHRLRRGASPPPAGGTPPNSRLRPPERRHCPPLDSAVAQMK